MISVKINGLSVTMTGNPTLERNIKEEFDTGKIVIVSTRELRYEMYDTVDVTTAYDTEQYVIQADSKPKLNATEYEHTLTLMENMALLDIIYPADRSFKVKGQTLGDILLVYKRELEQYHNTTITYDTMTTAELAETIPFKEFSGLNMSAILLSLFRKIWAVPKVTRVGTELDIYPLYHNQKNNLISEDSISVIEQQNNIDYATRIKSQLKNAVNERGVNEVSWFPSESGYVLPRSSSLEKITSKLRYELDSDIVSILKGTAVAVEYTIYNTVTTSVDTLYIDVDLTTLIVQEEAHDFLPITTSVSVGVIDQTDNNKNHIRYKVGQPYITNLFESSTEGVVFGNDTYYLRWAIMREVERNTATYFDPTYYTGSNPAIQPLDTEDVKMRFKYVKRRDIDLIHQRKTKGFMNNATAIHQQRDSSIEINEYKKNLDLYANRMGNTEKSKTKIFTGVEPYQLFDYTDDKTIVTRVQNTYHNTFTYCEYEESENFSNIEAEYALMRRSDPYTITAKSVTTNLISQEFIEFSEVSRSMDTILEDSSRRMLLGMFEATTIPFDKVSVGVFKPTLTAWNSDYAISMPVEPSGDANSITLHVQFTHQNIAGKTFYNLDTDAIVDYLNPLPYTDVNGTLEDFKLYFTPDILFEDTGEYPLILDETLYLADKLTSNVIEWPLDLDTAASFAFTFELSMIADENIYIGNALSTENYFIKDQATTSAIKIYSSTKPYSSYDQVPRTADTDITATAGYVYSFANRSHTFSPSIALNYFAIVKDDKILLAVNKVVASGGTYVFYVNHINENIIVIVSATEASAIASIDSSYLLALNLATSVEVSAVGTIVGGYLLALNLATSVEVSATGSISGVYSLALNQATSSSTAAVASISGTYSTVLFIGTSTNVLAIASLNGTYSTVLNNSINTDVAAIASLNGIYSQDLPNTTDEPIWQSNTVLSDTSARVYYKNDDTSEATIYITVNGVEYSSTATAGETIFITATGLTEDTTYTSTAYAVVSGETQSPTTSSTGTGFTTDHADVTYTFDNLTGATPSSYADVTVEYDSTVNSPGSPEKDGYTFTGWDPELPEYHPISDETCYAQWSANSYNVVFNSNGGIGTMSSQSIVFNTSEALTANSFTRSGYTFNGWNTVSGGTGTSYADTASFTMNVLGDTLYAQWTESSTQTDAPSITDSYYNPNNETIGWKVQNDDSSTATLYSDLADSTPTEFVDSDIASGAKGALHVHATFGGATIYAKAQASGETLSNYTSQYEG